MSEIMKDGKQQKAYRNWMARLSLIESEYPFGPITIYRNDEGRFHRDDGPAYISPTRICWYRDGRKHGVEAHIWGSVTYYYRGILVPPKYIREPEKLTVEEVLKNGNTEVRYVGMLIIGYDKLVQQKFVKQIHSTEEPYRRLFLVSEIMRNPFCVLEVLNGTPEPDGSYKTYFLTVPGNVKTCQEAVAWTFKMDEKEYMPEVET